MAGSTRANPAGWLLEMAVAIKHDQVSQLEYADSPAAPAEPQCEAQTIQSPKE